MNNLYAVAVGEGGACKERLGNDFEIALDGDLARIQLEHAQQALQVRHRVVLRFTVHDQSHGASL